MLAPIAFRLQGFRPSVYLCSSRFHHLRACCQECAERCPVFVSVPAHSIRAGRHACARYLVTAAGEVLYPHPTDGAGNVHDLAVAADGVEAGHVPKVRAAVVALISGAGT
jgi:hypothetical protein